MCMCVCICRGICIHTYIHTSARRRIYVQTKRVSSVLRQRTCTPRYFIMFFIHNSKRQVTIHSHLSLYARQLRKCVRISHCSLTPFSICTKIKDMYTNVYMMLTQLTVWVYVHVCIRSRGPDERLHEKQNRFQQRMALATHDCTLRERISQAQRRTVESYGKATAK